MAKKIRWADGDTRLNPCIFVKRAELERLGVTLNNPHHSGDIIDTNELEKLRLLAQYRTADQASQHSKGWGLVLVVVGYHITVLVWALTRK